MGKTYRSLQSPTARDTTQYRVQPMLEPNSRSPRGGEARAAACLCGQAPLRFNGTQDGTAGRTPGGRSSALENARLLRRLAHRLDLLHLGGAELELGDFPE